MGFALFELFEHLDQGLGLRNHHVFAHHPLHAELAGSAACPYPHEILVIQNANDLFRLVAIDREPRMLMLDHRLQYLVQLGLHRHGDHLVSGYHDLSHVQILQLHDAMNHVFLKRRQMPGAAA